MKPRPGGFPRGAGLAPGDGLGAGGGRTPGTPWGAMSKPRDLASSGVKTEAYIHETNARNGCSAAIMAGLGVKTGRGEAGGAFGATLICDWNTGGAPPPPGPPPKRPPP